MRGLIVLAFLLPLYAHAQSGDIPRNVIEQLARDLADLQKSVVEAQARASSSGMYAADTPHGNVAVTEPTLLRASASDNAATVMRARKGDVYKVLAESNGWYAVQAQSPVQGSITGWLKPNAAMPISSINDLKDMKRTSSASIDNVFVALAEQAAKFKQSYQNNPYVSVSGFQVNVVPPSISINFEFKK